MKKYTTKMRMEKIYNFEEPDRTPIFDTVWNSTLERWQKEGMPDNINYIDYFDLDKIKTISVDCTPRYPVKTIKETDEYTIRTSKWGTTVKDWKHQGGVPEFLDYKITDPESWEEAKARMKPTRDRINWDYLEKNYNKWREDGAWISAGFWFGFDVTHSWMVGTERLLTAIVMQPKWVKDMFNHFLELNIKLFQMIWDEGYHFDEIRWPDDMGYKDHQFFSLSTYKNLLKPFHEKAIKWAHKKGIKAQLHSCGNINPFVPELVEIGLDMLNPLEVKAGMDPIKLKKEYSNKLAFNGGLNAVLFNKPDKLWKEMKNIIPIMKKDGGYVISSDHSVPEAVSLDLFSKFVRRAKELGSYRN